MTKKLQLDRTQNDVHDAHTLYTKITAFWEKKRKEQAFIG